MRKLIRRIKFWPFLYWAQLELDNKTQEYWEGNILLADVEVYHRRLQRLVITRDNPPGFTYMYSPMFLGIDKYIIENFIPKGVSSGNFYCPHCLKKDRKHRMHDGSPLYIGPKEWRHIGINDPGYDFKEVMVCPIYKKQFWYLNGV